MLAENEEPVHNDNLPRYQNWMEKLSPNQLKSWQKRWVVLQGSTLRYWKSKESYIAEDTPSGEIHAHEVLSIDADPEKVLHIHMKILKDRIDVRKLEWRIWTNDSSSRRKGKGSNAVSAEAWNARMTWLGFFDEWVERFLIERLFSKYHVRKPAKFLDEVMFLEQEGPEDLVSTTTVVKKNGPKKLIQTLESYLDKRSPGFFGLWQRRWFVYLEAEDMIVYFKSREEYLTGGEPVGSFQVKDLNTVEGVGGFLGRELHIETMSAPEGGGKKPLKERMDRQQSGLGDSLNLPSKLVPSEQEVRTYKLRALTTESRDQWVQQMKARINSKSKASLLKRVQSSLKPSFVANNGKGTGSSPGSSAAMSPKARERMSGTPASHRKAQSESGLNFDLSPLPLGIDSPQLGAEVSQSRDSSNGTTGEDGGAYVGRARQGSESELDSVSGLNRAASPSIGLPPFQRTDSLNDFFLPPQAPQQQTQTVQSEEIKVDIN